MTMLWFKWIGRFVLHFISVTVRCTTLIYYMTITAIYRLQKSFLEDDKAQESGSRKVSPNSPGNQDLGCHRLALQMHTSCLKVKLQFFHTPYYPQTAPPFSATSALQQNNNRSGANHVTTIFTVYVGLLCVIGDGDWVMGVHCFVSSYWLACILYDCINLLPKWKRLLCLYLALSVR